MTEGRPKRLLFVPDDRPLFSLTETSHRPACLLLLVNAATFHNPRRAACACIIIYFDVINTIISNVVSLECPKSQGGFRDEMKGDNWSGEGGHGHGRASVSISGSRML